MLGPLLALASVLLANAAYLDLWLREQGGIRWFYSTRPAPRLIWAARLLMLVACFFCLLGILWPASLYAAAAVFTAEFILLAFYPRLK